MAVVLAAALAGCGGRSAPAAFSLHCSGHTLPGPDTSEVFANDPVLPPPATAVPGIPHPSGSVRLKALPGALDPANPAFGYADPGGNWQLQMISDSGAGQPLWSVSLPVPRGVSRSEPDLDLLAHDGYAVAIGGNLGQYIGSVSSAGRPGPACTVPAYTATDAHVELLPHAGIVLLSNPASDQASTGSGDDYWLDGYSTATSQRVWSVSTGDSVAGDAPGYMVSNDTVYLWQDAQTRVVALDARTGQQMWATSFSNDTSQYAGDDGLIAVYGGTVYAMVGPPSESSWVVALNAATGAIRWKRTVPLASAPSDVAINAVGQDQILMGDSDSSEEYLLDARTGATLASAKVGSSAVGDNDTLQVCHPAGQLAIAVPDNGVIHLLSADPAVNRGIPIPPGKNVSVAVASTEAYVLEQRPGGPVLGYDLATGKLLWTVAAPGSNEEASLQAVNGGFILEGNGTGTVYR